MRGSSHFTSWIHFMCEVICDFVFLALWLTLTWAVHEFIGNRFSVGGVAGYTTLIIEAVLDASVLIKLCKLRFRFTTQG